LNFIMYYPRVGLSLCITGDVRVARDFSKKYGNVDTFAKYAECKNFFIVVFVCQNRRL